MSGPLRQTIAKFAQNKSHVSHSAFSQRRFAGDLPVKNNKFIEDWGTYREHVEDTFKFDAKTLTAVGIFGIAFPVFLYNNIVGEYRKVDRAAGRKQRDFM